MARNQTRMTPYFALTKSPSLKVGASGDLQGHILEMLALEALTNCVAGAENATTEWTTSISKQTDKGALSLAAFRGKVEEDPDTGRPVPSVSAERGLSMEAFRALGLFDDLGHADRDWPDDDVALGINFSRLHRIARLVENRAEAFMQGLVARMQEDIRSQDIYPELEKAAEARRRRAEEERQRREEEWAAERAERERREVERRERIRAEALAFKRRVAALHGLSYENDDELDRQVQTATNTTPKGYENEFGQPMPDPWAKQGPFTWARLPGVANRIFFDASGERIPEPS